MAKKARADQILVESGLAGDLEQARRLVMAGKVFWNDQVVIQASQPIGTTDSLE